MSRTMYSADDMTQRVGEAASEAGAAVRDAARRVSSAAGGVSDEALQRANRYGKDVLDQVERQPLAALLVAAAAGFMAGVVISRR